MTSYAYGEVKAPSEVDTLRDESCPVCGETDAWDGDECKVCDYVAPPQKFQDPDVDMHKKLDLRSDQQADMTAGDLNAAVNDQDGDGLDDRTGEPIEQEDEMGADDVQPALICPVCGFEAPAPEPMSISTEDPEAGSTGGQPVEGDLCPNCGKGVLESSENLGMGMEGDGPDEQFAEEEGDEQRGDAPPEDEEPGENGPPDADDERADDVDSAPPEEDDDEVDDEERPAKKAPFPPKK